MEKTKDNNDVKMQVETRFCASGSNEIHISFENMDIDDFLSVYKKMVKFLTSITDE